MTQWIATLMGLIVTVILAIIAMISSQLKKERSKGEKDTVFADSLKNHDRKFIDIENKFSDKYSDHDRRLRVHDNFWRATEIRMTEFTQIQKDIVTLKTDFKDVCKRMEEAEEKRNVRDERMDEKFDDIKDTLHRFELVLTKLSK